MKLTYQGLNVEIEPLLIDQSDLNTKRMLDLMAAGQNDGPMPLYLHTVNRILREMRIEQQKNGGPFKYLMFRKKVLGAALTPSQLGPLKQRLDTLESFMPKSQVAETKQQVPTGKSGNDWTPKVRKLRYQSCNYI